MASSWLQTIVTMASSWLQRLQKMARKCTLLWRICKIILTHGYSPVAQSPQEILFFWLQRIKDYEKFQKSIIVDAYIRRSYLKTLLAAADASRADASRATVSLQGKWRQSIEGIQALIIIFDQFPRNIFRNHEDSFAYDKKALEYSRLMLQNYGSPNDNADDNAHDNADDNAHGNADNGAYGSQNSGSTKSTKEEGKQKEQTSQFSQLDPQARTFALMPFMHSENLATQKEGLAHFAKYSNEHVQHFARLHLDIVEKFQRFPHRNQILGRVSTKEELEFLKTPNSSF